MRKLCSVLAIMIGIFCFTASAALAAGFRDLPRSYTFYDEVVFLSEKSIISGFPDASFRATAYVTRAEAAIMIGRALELDGSAKNTKFRDVTAKVTGSGYIAAAVEKGIITGFPDGTYRPHENVTRGQMAIFLNRAFTLSDSTLSNKFNDVTPNMKAYQSILNVYANGIANGYPDGTYRSDTEVTRGQFSAFMARALDPSFRGAPTTFSLESISGWKPGDAIAEVDIEHDWVIKFTDTFDKNSIEDHINIVRESDHKQHYFEIQSMDPKTIKLSLGNLYDLDETYYLYISEDIKSKMGDPLAEPLKIKFHTNTPEFNVNKIIEQDGVRMEVLLAQSDEKIYAKLKATNISNEDIPYTGFDGCDPGIGADLFAETDAGSNRVGSKWSGAAQCTMALEDYVLKPDTSVETVEVLYLPKQQVSGELFVKAAFQKGRYHDNSSIKPIVVSVPLEELKQVN